MVLKAMIGKTLKRYLSWRTRPQLVKKFFRDKQIKPSTNCSSIRLEQVRVAAAQVPLYLVDDPLEWVELIYRQVAKGAAAGAHLIVFPEHITLHLLGLIPGIKKLAHASLDQPTTPSNKEPAPTSIAELFGIFGAGVEGLYRATMSYLAKEFRVYIMGGSRPVPEAHGVVNQATLFDPEGQPVGSQNKAHLLPMEAQWGMCPGARLDLYQTELGNIAFPVCMDATYFETFRILSLLGADVVIIPIANPEEYNMWKALRGIWPRVQESYVYGIKSALVGKNFFGLSFTGKAGIFAPIEIKPPDGIVNLAENPVEEDLVIGDLDILRLRNNRDSRLRGADINLPLYRRYFPKIYSSAGTMNTSGYRH